MKQPTLLSSGSFCGSIAEGDLRLYHRFEFVARGGHLEAQIGQGVRHVLGVDRQLFRVTVETVYEGAHIARQRINAARCCGQLRDG